MLDAALAATATVMAKAEAAAAELWAASDRFDDWDADLDAMMRPLRSRGLFVACLPPEEGGSGLATDHRRAADLEVALRRLGGGSLSAGRLFEGHVNAVKLVFLYGKGAAARAFARDVRAGSVSGVWNAAVPPGPVLTWAEGCGRLRGVKIYCSGAGWVDRPLVTARFEDGVCITAPRLGAGVEVDLTPWRANGMRATASGEVTFIDCPVTAEEVIGEPGDYLRAPAFKGGAWRFCAVQLGGAERLFSLLVQNLEGRGRRSDPHQGARVGQAAVAVESARLWVASARRVAEREGASPEAEAYVGLARTAVEAACVALLQTVDRCVGLEARMQGAPIERVARDLATYLRQPFPDAVLNEAAAARLSAADADPHAEWSR